MAMKCPNCGFDLKFAGVAKKLQQSHPKAFQLWSTEEEDRLDALVQAGKNVLEISRALGRHPTSVQKRIQLLGLQQRASAPPAPAPAGPQPDYLPQGSDPEREGY